MKAVFRFAERWSVFVIALAWLAYQAVTYLWPASWWMEVPVVRVQDSKVGKPVYVFVDRTIKREFTAQWTAVVRAEDNRTVQIVCAADALSDYRPGASMPAKLTLEWWTNGRCPTLPNGRYVLTTLWLIRGNALLPDKEVKAVSNVFEVTE